MALDTARILRQPVSSEANAGVADGRKHPCALSLASASSKDRTSSPNWTPRPTRLQLSYARRAAPLKLIPWTRLADAQVASLRVRRNLPFGPLPGNTHGTPLSYALQYLEVTTRISLPAAFSPALLLIVSLANAQLTAGPGLFKRLA
jgi:hypothetical protein